jgi:hypothetical protein
LAILSALALAAAVALAATAHAAETPSTAPIWHTDFLGTESANLLADAAGVTVQPDVMSLEKPQPLYQRLDAAGTTTWSAADYRGNYNYAVADLAGNLFEIKTDYSDSTAAPVLRLRTANGIKWSTPLPADSADASLALGNNRVYAINNSRAKTIATFNASDGTPVGAVNLSATSDARVLHAYDGGVAAVSAIGTVVFVGPNGQLLHQYDGPSGYSFTEAFAVTATGATYVVARSITDEQSYLVRFTPEAGLSWVKPLPAPLGDYGLTDYRLVTTSDGGAVVGVNGVQWPTGTAPALAKFASTGANSWVNQPGTALSSLLTLQGTSTGGLIVGTRTFASCAASLVGCTQLDFALDESATGDQTANLARLGSLTTADNYEFFNNPYSTVLAAQANRLYLSTRLTDANGNHIGSVLAFATPNIGTSYPQTTVRATVTIGSPDPTPTAAPTPTATTPTSSPTVIPPGNKSAVFLGDSYSSGEGAPAIVNGKTQYTAGTDQGDNRCHRSAAAYGPLVSQTLDASYRTRFHACSGAVIADFYSSYGTNHKDVFGNPLNSAEIPQLNWITKNTRLVTLTVGGNNVNFAEVMLFCATRKTIGSTCQGLYGKLIKQKIGQLRSSGALRKLYRDIKARTAPNAKVLVLAYPRFFPTKPPITCPTGAGAQLFVDSDMLWINQSIKELDGVIEQEANQAGVTYVDAYGMLKRHELCTKDPWLNRTNILSGVSGSFHPKIRGQQAYSDILKPYLD